MKTLYLPALLLLLFLAGCEKEEDDSGTVCTSDCTLIRGKVLTSGSRPLAGMELEVCYEKFEGIHYHLTRRKAVAQTEKDGHYEMKFYLKDDENQENSFSSYYEMKIDLETLDPEKYIFPQDLTIVPGIAPEINGSIDLLRDTVYEVNVYLPQKKHIDVILQGFEPQQEGDRFEVRTFFPWGFESDGEKLLDTPYEIANSGFDRFVATGKYQRFTDVPFPLNDSVVVSILKVKNGKAIPEDHRIYVSEDSPASLTYEY